MFRSSLNKLTNSIKAVHSSSIPTETLCRSLSMLSQKSVSATLPSSQSVRFRNQSKRTIKMKSPLSFYAPVESLVEMLQKGETQNVLEIVNNTLIPYKSNEYAQLIKNSKDSKTIHELFQSAKQHNIYMDYAMCASALDAFLTLKDYKSAELLFNEYHSQHASNYNSYLCNVMLKIYDETNMYQNALNLVHRICNSGQCPSTTTFSILLFLLLKNECWKEVDSLLVTMKQLSIVLPSSLSTQLFNYYYKANHEIPSLLYSVIHIDNNGNTADHYLKNLKVSVQKKNYSDILSIYNEIQSKNIHIPDPSLLYSIEEALFTTYKGLALPKVYDHESNQDLKQLYLLHSYCFNHEWTKAFTELLVPSLKKEQMTPSSSLYFSFFLSQFFSAFNNSNEEYNQLFHKLNHYLPSIPLSIPDYEYIFSHCSSSPTSHTHDVFVLYSTLKSSSLIPTSSIFYSLFQICKGTNISMNIIELLYHDLFTYHIKRDKQLYMALLPLFMEPSMTKFQSILRDMEKDDIHLDSDIYHLIFTGFIQNQKYYEGIQYYVQHNHDIETDLQIKLDIMNCSLYSKDQKMLMATLNNISQSHYEKDYELIYAQFKELLDTLSKRETLEAVTSFYNVILKSYMNTHSLLSFPKYLLKKYPLSSLSPTLKQLLWNSYMNHSINIKLNNHLVDTPLLMDLIHLCPSIDKSVENIMKEIKNCYTSSPPASLLPSLLNYYIKNDDLYSLYLFTTHYIQSFQQIYEPAVLHLIASCVAQQTNQIKNPANSNESYSIDSFIDFLLSQASSQILTESVLSYIGSYYAYKSKNEALNRFISKYPHANINMQLFKNYTTTPVRNNKNNKRREKQMNSKHYKRNMKQTKA